jgi:hypothetical protein
MKDGIDFSTDWDVELPKRMDKIGSITLANDILKEAIDH